MTRTALPNSRNQTLPEGVLRAVSLEGAVLFVVVCLSGLASREMAQAEWDLEWLVTLPIPLRGLILVRILERTILNPTGLLGFWPFLAATAHAGGTSWTWAIVRGFWSTIPLLSIVAVLRMLVDTGLKLRISAPRLRNLQALISIATTMGMFVALAPASSPSSWLVRWADVFPGWALYAPSSLAVYLVGSSHASGVASYAAAMFAEAALSIALGHAILVRVLSRGVVAAGGRETGRRAFVAQQGDSGSARRLLTPIQSREFRLLARDRNFMVQTLLLPLLIIGVQFFSSDRSELLSKGADASLFCAAAFGITSYTLMFSAFQILNAEGQALWLLFTFPRRLEAILREKILLWGSIASVYLIGILAYGYGWSGGLSPEGIARIVVVLAGVIIFAVIAGALGILGSDPLNEVVQRRISPGYLYLYMLLVSFYFYAIYVSDFWQRLATMVLMTLLALALWQKARDRLPYLLDPTASPPPRVSTADGLIAAVAFFVAQAVVAVIYRGASFGETLVVAFASAGVLTYTAVRTAFWKAGTADVPRVFDPSSRTTPLWGLLGGLAASVLGLVYIHLAPPPEMEESTRLAFDAAKTLEWGSWLWLPVLGVVAAPIFEEFIFRGLIFRGLRRSLGLVGAVLASSAIFAIVHPPFAVPPVFAMAVCAALVYERTNVLLGPMIVHATYNAIVLGAAWYFP